MNNTFNIKYCIKQNINIFGHGILVANIRIRAYKRIAGQTLGNFLKIGKQNEVCRGLS